MVALRSQGNWRWEGPLGSLGGLKGVKPPEAFGERPRDWSLGHAGDEGPHLSMTGESRAERAAAEHLAYQDVSAAFRWYLDHENNGRGLILQ